MVLICLGHRQAGLTNLQLALDLNLICHKIFSITKRGEKNLVQTEFFFFTPLTVAPISVEEHVIS